MVNLRGILLILVLNAVYFVLTDSASLHRMPLIPFQIWVAILLVAILYFSLDTLGERHDGTVSSLGLRFVGWLSLLMGILLILFPSGSTLSDLSLSTYILLNLGSIGFFGYFLHVSGLPDISKRGWYAYLVFLLCFSLLTVSAFFKFNDLIVLLLFIIGELVFLGGVVLLISRNRRNSQNLVFLALTGLGAAGFGFGATNSDVMFLVSNLIITRVVGSLSLEGVIGGTLLYFLTLIQFSVVFVLILLERRWDLLALGLTGISFTFPPILAVRSILLLEFMQGRIQEVSAPLPPQTPS